MDLTGKKIAVLGAGRSGMAAARLARDLGGDVTLYDTKEEIVDVPRGVMPYPGASEELGCEVYSDLLVISPGIDTYGSYVKAFAKNTGELIGELELAARCYKGKVIAITGTNGKTTTTEVIEKILNHAGIPCRPCGNYGIPLAEVVLETPDLPAVALEVSSFQLETISQFRPDVVVWLNFSADHMDRYPTIEAYKSAKMRIFENLSSEQTVVYRAGEQLGELECKLLSFSTEVDADYTFDGKWIQLAGEPVLDIEQTRLRGLHNAENAMAALAACAQLGVKPEQAAEALAGVAPPLHRCELVRILDNIEYINDSKATNIHALDNALRSQSRQLVLIAGGKDKGLDYSVVLDRLKHHAKSAVVFGEIGDQLEALFAEVLPVKRVESLESAVLAARDLAEAGDTVLFSPGTSSFDMFSGYEARGDAFREFVLNLK